MIKKISYLTVLLAVTLISCTSEYNDKNVIIQDENRKYILGHLYENEGFRISFGTVLQSANRNPDTVGEQLLIYQNKVIFDTLDYLGRGAHPPQGLTYQYASSSDKRPRSEFIYEIKVEGKFYTFGIIPQKPLIDSVVYSPYIFKQASNNYYGEGTIYLNIQDTSKYLGILFEYDEVYIDDTFHVKIPIELPRKYLCKGNKRYIEDVGYISLSTECIESTYKKIDFFYPNLSVSRRMINPQIRVCTIREDMAIFYGNKDVLPQGTDFFFTPSQKTKLPIDEEELLGLLSCVSCNTLIVKLKE